MSPDPAGMMAVDIGSPQTLNRYAYVLNNPLSFTDPFGLDCAYLNSSGTGIEKGGIDQNSSSGECGKTGGYWVDGTIAQVNIDSNATTISLTGTTNGTNQTNASYQQDAGCPRAFLPELVFGEYFDRKLQLDQGTETDNSTRGGCPTLRFVERGSSYPSESALTPTRLWRLLSCLPAVAGAPSSRLPAILLGGLRAIPGFHFQL